MVTDSIATNGPETGTTPETAAPKAKWTGGPDLGKIQANRFNKAWSSLNSLHNLYTEITGVKGGEEHRYTLWSPFSPMHRADVAAEAKRIGDKYGWILTKGNAAKATAEVLAAITILRAPDKIPTIDKREEPEVRAERDALIAADTAKREAKDAEAKASHATILAKKPPGAAAVILAELHEDTSDLQSDYSGHRTVRTVAIGWRFGSREDFKQLRRAAASFPETQHLGPEAPADVEHRDNYSMGHGNYVKKGWIHSGGWCVESKEPSRLHGIVEDALPVANEAPEPFTCTDFADNGPGGGPVVSPSTQRDGYIEIRFPAKPDEATRNELKANGFRWAKSNGCWYGPEARLPQRYRA